MVSGSIAAPADGDTGSTVTDTDPGTRDPVGSPSNYAVFHSDVFYTILPTMQSPICQSYTPSADLRTLTPTGLTPSFPDCEAIVFAAGRILASPDGAPKEQAVGAYPDGVGNLAVAFPDIAGSPTLLPKFKSTINNTINLGDDFMAIACGDLDKVPDSKGINHDEVVVAYVSAGEAANQDTVNVVVLNYTDVPFDNPYENLGSPAITETAASDPIDEASFDRNRFPQPYILPSGNVLALALGDFDGDGQNEIAVTYLQNTTTLRVVTFRYLNDGLGNRSLRQESSVPAGLDNGNPAFLGAVTAVATDLDGDGKDELAVGLGEWYSDWSKDFSIWIKTFCGDAKPTMTQVSATLVRRNGFLYWDDTRLRPQLMAGLFRYDPADGFGMSRRQLALAYGFGGCIAVCTYSADADLQLSELYPPYVRDRQPTVRTFAVATGGFKGLSDKQDPVWGLAFAICNSDGTSAVEMVAVSPQGLTLTAVASNPSISADLSPEVVAYDRDGKSVYLGAPIHLTVNNVVTTDFVLHEPPKHAYFDAASNDVVNVSRNDFFNVRLIDSNQTTFESKSSDTSDKSIGGSTAISAGYTYNAGIRGITPVSGEASVDFNATAAYNYDQNESKYNSNYASRSITTTGETTRDDYVSGRFQTLHIWRYRVYNINNPNQDAPNVFYDVVLPGETEEFEGGALNFDWYQPIHENGNILSYPQALGSDPSNSDTPDDLGPFILPTGDSTLEPLIPASVQFFDGTGGSIELQYSSVVGQGDSFSYQRKLSESADLKASFSATVQGFVAEWTYRGSIDVQFNNSNSWGGMRTSDSTTGKTTGITLNRYAGDATRSYSFSPIFYVTKDGTVKVCHSVNVLGSASGAEFWSEHYGKLPDPALNLPLRFYSDGFGGWLSNEDISRKQIRGFFLTSPEIDPDLDLNDYQYLTVAPVDGDQVRVVARVYNYSVGKATGPFTVRFQAIQFDDSSHTEVGSRQTIGETVLALDPLEMREASIIWDTTGFGPSIEGTAMDYRIYVMLNPQFEDDGKTPNPNFIPQEIYPAEEPGTIDPGQNNEGYGLATVAAKPSAVSGMLATGPADISMTPDSIAVLRGADNHPSGVAQVPVHTPVTLRFSVYATQPGRAFSHLLVFDGDPDRGGKLIADKRIFTGNAGARGNHVSMQWIPRTVGAHEIFARVLEGATDAVPGNNRASLPITVLDSR